MPIVLAIEPDRRQAAHLTAIVQHRVGAELILADTTEGALDAIGNRVPDLVLVPALLSPTDDAALAAALRVIAAAAHVRTLTIPVLSSGIAHQSAPVGGMLAKWRKKSASPEPDGCDPAVFGEQISAYLAESAAQRAEFEESLEFAGPPAPSQSYAAFEPPPVVEPMAPVHAFAPPPASWHMEEFAPSEPVAIHEEAVYHEPEPIAAAMETLAPMVEEPIAEEPVAAAPFDAWAAETQHAHQDTDDDNEEDDEDDDEGPLIDLSDELEGLSEDEVGRELFDGEQVGVYMISANEEEPVVNEFDLLPAILKPLVLDTPDTATALLVEHAAPEPVEMMEPIAIEPYAAAPMVAVYAAAEAYFDAPEAPRSDIDPWVPMYLTPGRIWPALEGVPAETPVARTEQPDWIELVASLRQDLERRRTDPAAPAPSFDPIAVRPSDGRDAEVHQLVKKQKLQIKKAKPVQDEWGFFDPEQCGFSTLLAKLEEITDDEVRT